MITTLSVMVTHNRIGNTSEFPPNDSYSPSVIAKNIEAVLNEAADKWEETKHYGNPISVTVVKEKCSTDFS